MKKEFADIHSLYENLYEDLEQLDEIGPLSKTQKLKARQARLSQVKSDWQARRSANNTPAPTPVAKPVVQQKPVGGAATSQNAKPAPRLSGAQRAQQMAKERIASGSTAPRLSGAQRAQQMAKDRIAAGRNTVTGALKSPAPQAQPAPQQQRVVSGQGNRQIPVKTGGIQAGQAIRGGLNKLGSLAGRAVNAARNTVSNVAGKVSNVAGNVSNALATKGQSTTKPVQGQQTKPVQGQKTGGSLNQAAANIDAMRSPASGSRQVKPGLIGRLLPNHPGNKGQQTTSTTKPVVQSGGQQGGGTQQTTSTTKPVAQSGGTTTSSPNAMGGKTTTTQSGNRTTVTNTGGTNLKRDGAAETIKKFQAIQNYKKSKGLPYQKVTIGKEGDPDPFNFHYEPVGDLISDSFDITVDFLINEGHATDTSEAISIMSDPEFIAGFNAELNESFENNK